jgi:hypothetical protein
MLAEEAADDSRGISAAIKQPPSISIFALFIVFAFLSGRRSAFAPLDPNCARKFLVEEIFLFSCLGEFFG